MFKLDYAKCNPNAITPVRANPSDGLDVFVPHEAENIELHVGDNQAIGTGIKMVIPHGYGLFVKNKSGVAAKRSLIKGAELIDHGYKGEIFIDIHNIGTELQIIKAGDKLAQLVLMPIIPFDLNEVHEDNLYNNTFVSSGRGEGALGSTGTTA